MTKKTSKIDANYEASADEKLINKSFGSGNYIIKNISNHSYPLRVGRYTEDFAPMQERKVHKSVVEHPDFINHKSAFAIRKS